MPKVTGQQRERVGRAQQDQAERFRRQASRNRRILLIGAPNVGKSVIFHGLTGRYVLVSNYPGTTVEVAGGRFDHSGHRFWVVDSPGIYSLLPMSEDEAVTRELLVRGGFDLVVHVVDAKNLARMLPLTLQLLHGRRPVVLILNMMDEAERLGIRIDVARLSRYLDIPILAISAIQPKDLERLKTFLADPAVWDSNRGPGCSAYPSTDLLRSEWAAGGAPRAHQLSAKECDRLARGAWLKPRKRDIIRQLAGLMRGSYGVLAPEMVATLLLAGDERLLREVKAREPAWRDIFRLLEGTADIPFERLFAPEFEVAARLCRLTVTPRDRRAARTALEWLTTWPLTGFAFLLLFLYVGMYLFVGRFCAGVVVDFLDQHLFAAYIEPTVNWLIDLVIPSRPLQDLLAHQYGIFTFGLRYSLAVILPVIAAFFLVFAIVEDSGYLPRLAFLTDWLCRFLGLNGRAVIPLTLGLGCGTMATVVTRTLSSERERFIATYLLALAVPCSAQLGVIMALLSRYPGALTPWLVTVGLVFGLSGVVLNRVLVGSRPPFVVEIPPLRLPRVGNVLMKTKARLEWYLREILIILLLASVVVWLGQLSGWLDALAEILDPVLRRMGLPRDSSLIFLLGFLRRDYGAAGLYDLQLELSIKQTVVAATVLTLFLPCVAQLAVMIRERGFVRAMLITSCVLTTALATGILQNVVLSLVWG